MSKKEHSNNFYSEMIRPLISDCLFFRLSFLSLLFQTDHQTRHCISDSDNRQHNSVVSQRGTFTDSAAHHRTRAINSGPGHRCSQFDSLPSSSTAYRDASSAKSFVEEHRPLGGIQRAQELNA
jgi:hypothetical protein